MKPYQEAKSIPRSRRAAVLNLHYKNVPFSSLVKPKMIFDVNLKACLKILLE